MNRSHVALVVLFSTFAGVYAIAAPARDQPPTSPVAFFPTAVGTKWVYHVEETIGGRPSRRRDGSEVIGATVKENDEWHVSSFGVDDATSMVGEWLVSERGLFHRSAPGGSALPAHWEMFLPARVVPGQTWASERSSERRVTPWRHTIAKWETVRVSAGTFRAIRVDSTCDILSKRGGKVDGSMSLSSWLAPGIGLVKYELQMDAEQFRQYGTVFQTHELTFFAPGAR